MLTKRRRDWMRGNPIPVLTIFVLTPIMVAALVASARQGLVTFSFEIFCIAGIYICLFAVIRRKIGRLFPYPLHFERWQDHEIPPDEYMARFDRIVNYCVKRNIPARIELCNGIGCCIWFLYEDDLHEANLAAS